MMRSRQRLVTTDVMHTPADKRLIAFAVAIGALGCLFHLALEFVMRPYAVDGLYQVFSSEDMMQTVSIEDLRNEPLRTLLHIHTQPPGLDTIRASLALLWPTAEAHSLVRHVDHAMYVVWALLAGLMAALIFWWLSKTTTVPFAIMAALFVIPHPGAIFYATFLESTFLSATLVLWTYYFLWRLRDDPHRSLVPLTLGVIALFFTRSLFQLPAIGLFAVCLLLFRVRYQRVVVFLLVAGGAAGIYVTKQYYLFGTVTTFGPAGLNLCRAIGVHEDRYSMEYYLKKIETLHATREQRQTLPSVLVRELKLTGSPNLNHIGYLPLNVDFMNHCTERLRAMPLMQLARSYLENGRIYFSPSSRYTTAHTIVDRLPWRNLYDRIVSFPVLPVLLACAALVWAATARRSDLLSGMALALPGAYILLASVVGEKDEDMRLKFLLEPVLIVFIATQGYALGQQLYRKHLASSG